MDILEILSSARAKSGNNFLVIGGYAVNAHGYQRQTIDLDLLINKARKDDWAKVMLKNDYAVFCERDAFLQFTPMTKARPAVDFMLVNENTFSNMHAEAVEGMMGGVKVKHPSLMHLIALKLHVIKQALPHRELRDLYDVIQLVNINHVDTKADVFKQLCEKFGNLKIYETIVRATR